VCHRLLCAYGQQHFVEVNDQLQAYVISFVVNLPTRASAAKLMVSSCQEDRATYVRALGLSAAYDALVELHHRRHQHTVLHYQH